MSISELQTLSLCIWILCKILIFPLQSRAPLPFIQCRFLKKSHLCVPIHVKQPQFMHAHQCFVLWACAWNCNNGRVLFVKVWLALRGLRLNLKPTFSERSSLVFDLTLTLSPPTGQACLFGRLESCTERWCKTVEQNVSGQGLRCYAMPSYAMPSYAMLC